MTIPPKIVVVAIAVATSLLGDSTLYVVLPSHAEQLGINLAFVGIILSVNRFVRLFTNSLAGYVHDYTGRWWHFVVALALGALTTGTYGLFSRLIWIFLLARLVWGTCWSFLRLEGYVTVIQQAAEQDRGKLMGLYNSIVGIGFFAGSLFGGILTDKIGYRSCLLSFAALTFLGAIATFFKLSQNHSPKDVGKKTKRERGTVGERENGKPTPHSPTGPPARFRSLWLRHWQIYYTGFANVLVSNSAVSSTLGLLIKTRLGSVIQIGRASIKVASLTGILLAVRWSISFFFAPVFGGLADRFGRKFVLLPGLLLGIIALSILVTQQRLLWIGTAAILASISRTTVSASLDASIADIASVGRRGKAIGIYTTSTDLGSAIGPLVSYFVSALIGAQLGLERIYLAGVMLLISAILASLGLKSP